MFALRNKKNKMNKGFLKYFTNKTREQNIYSYHVVLRNTFLFGGVDLNSNYMYQIEWLNCLFEKS